MQPRRVFNELDRIKTYPANDKWQAHLLEQYKLYLGTADGVSTRRAAANSYFLSINSAVLAFIGYLSGAGTATEFLWPLAAAGLALSLLWTALIASYRRLSDVRYTVVREIEQRLPARPLNLEWELITASDGPAKYRPLTQIEQRVPYVFVVLHGVVFIRAFPWCWFAFGHAPGWLGCA
jgi:hypothetical protein